MLHSALFKKMKFLMKIALDILKRGFVKQMKIVENKMDQKFHQKKRKSF